MNPPGECERTVGYLTKLYWLTWGTYGPRRLLAPKYTVRFDPANLSQFRLPKIFGPFCPNFAPSVSKKMFKNCPDWYQGSPRGPQSSLFPRVPAVPSLPCSYPIFKPCHHKEFL